MKRLMWLWLTVSLVSTSLVAQPQYGTEVSGSVIFAVGKFASLYSIPGFGANLGFFFDIDPGTRAALTISYARAGLDGDAINDEFVDPASGSTANISGSTNGLPAMLSIRLLTPGPAYRMYGIIEGGFYMYWTNVEGTITQGGNTTSVKGDDEFRSEPAFNLGFGVLVPLEAEKSLDVAIRYHWIKDSQYYDVSIDGDTNNLSTSRYISLSIGVNFSFPSE